MGRSGQPQMAERSDTKSTDELELTPKMIEAGAAAVLGDPIVGQYMSEGLAAILAEEVLRDGLRAARGESDEGRCLPRKP